MIVSRNLPMYPPSLTLMAKLCWRSLVTLIYLEWHLISTLLLRRIFSQFPEQLLKGLVSAGCLHEFSMIDFFLEEAFSGLSSMFWSTVQQCGSWLQICTLNYVVDRVINGASFFNWGCVKSVTLHIIDLWQMAILCMLYKIRYNPMHPLYGDLPWLYVPVQVTCGA